MIYKNIFRYFFENILYDKWYQHFLFISKKGILLLILISTFLLGVSLER